MKAFITIDKTDDGHIFIVGVHGERFVVDDIHFDEDVFEYFNDRHIMEKLHRKWGKGEGDVKMADLSRRTES